MPVGIKTPSNQIKFTNVSVVRYKKGKKRFELACYKNKLLEYRSGTETDLDNVLQVHTVFLSVSKAQTAPAAELTKAFGRDVSADDIIQEILRKGEVQVGERERKEVMDRIEKEVVDIVSGRLVDPTTKRVYTPGMIEKALNQLSVASGQIGGGQQHHQQQQQQQQQAQPDQGQGQARQKEAKSHPPGAHPTPATDVPEPEHPRKPLWKGVVTNKSAKSQALDAMKALIAWQPIPVMRARMRLRVTCPVSLLKQPVKHSTGASNKGGGGGGAAADAPKKSHKKGQKSKSKKKHDDSDSEGASDAEFPSKPVAGIVKDKILSYIEVIESQATVGEDDWEVVGFAEPGAYKALSEFVSGETRGRGRIEVLDMVVTHED